MFPPTPNSSQIPPTSLPTHPTICSFSNLLLKYRQKQNFKKQETYTQESLEKHKNENSNKQEK